MTKTLTALTALAFAAAMAGGATAQTSGGAMATDKMASDHMAKKDGAMAKTDATTSGGMAMKTAKKKGAKPMAKGAMTQGATAQDPMAAKK
jgi:hypothetical protein